MEGLRSDLATTQFRSIEFSQQFDGLVDHGLRVRLFIVAVGADQREEERAGNRKER